MPSRSRIAEIVISALVLFALGLNATLGRAQEYRRYQKSSRLKANDYLLKSFNDSHDQAFEGNPNVVDLGLNLGVGSDCGRVNFEGTMKSTLKNLLNSQYFGDIGKNIIGSSPMLLTCYMSPTWCAILKHTQVNANFLSQMRLDQCALVDKYVDHRTEDYYQERQDCVRQKISQNGGDLEQAMGACQNVYNVDLKSWAGSSSGTHSSTNKLIESSTKWAGLTGAEADRTTDLVKAFVGDTVLAQGNVSVEYGSRGKALTPENHLKDLRGKTRDKLCADIMVRVAQDQGQHGAQQLVSGTELKDLSGGSEEILVDHQTIEALSFMPPAQRQASCRRLADTVALSKFTKDASRSVDVLTIATQNPNLPPQRKAELDEKRRRLKESIDLTLELERQRSTPLRNVLTEINQKGESYRDQYSDRLLREDESVIKSKRATEVFMDCGDNVMCGG